MKLLNTIAIIMLLMFTACENSSQQKTDQTDTKNVVTPTADPLPSWNDGNAKQAIINFVNRITKEGDSAYVKPSERIATFDNDGTLWSEQPYYFQLQFALDRVKEMAPQHPEWKKNPLLNAAINNDISKVFSFGEHGLLELVMTTHSGMTTEEFAETVKNWINTAKHPKTNRLYKNMVYQPMLELLSYLRANNFKTYIVSGGGIDFMRPWAEDVYGIPSEQVIGSSGKVKFEMREGKPVLIKLPEINFIDDKEGKPIGIHQYTGKRPIAAFGNSDGDLQMLQYTTGGSGKRFALYVHHTDSLREWAYDHNSLVGRLDKGLEEAQAKGWTVVDMKKDWNKIFAE
ncbi:HAD family hydrolase [soil metagenome]